MTETEKDKDPVMSALGKLGKGKRKALSQEERWRRAQRLAAVRGRRWLKSASGAEGRGPSYQAG